MFASASAFNGDISKWDVSNVADMDFMFWHATSFKHQLCEAAWVHSKATKAGMFKGSSGSISRTVCRAQKRPRPMAFSSKEELKSAIDACLDLSPQGDCSNGLHGAIGDWDVSSVTDMSDVFADANQFNSDISDWVVSSVTAMSNMFTSATSFNSDISKWDVSSVTSMSYMFASAVSFNGDISKRDGDDQHCNFDRP